MFSFLVYIYIATLLLCLATYAGYPLTIYLIGKIKPQKILQKNITPSVSIIISAFNEEKDIEEKIKNTLELDYPKEKLKILIGSDGSMDKTADIVKKYVNKGVIFFDYKTNRGKTSVQNDLVKQATGEILLFTDAAAFLPNNAVRKIVRNFADKQVGGVAGRMRFVNTDKNLTTQSQGLYWRYELKLRQLESDLGSLIGVDGPLYALKRDYYVPLGAHIISDLMTPLLILGHGKKVILDPEAVVEEEPKQRTVHEFTTRRRITLRGLVGIFTFKNLLNPMKHPFLALQIVFHKVLRWFVGPLVILNVLTCIFLSSHWLFQKIMFLNIAFFSAALLGWGASKVGISYRILTIPYYFCLVNLAATTGIIDFFMKKQAVTWKTVR